MLVAVAAVVATAAVPAVAAFKAGSYRGKTSQSRVLTFKVKGGKVTAFSAGVNMMCIQSGIEFNAAIPPGAMKIRGGRFSYRGRDKIDSVNLTIKGTISGSGAKGTLKMTDSRYNAADQSFDSCVGSATWTAKRR